MCVCVCLYVCVHLSVSLSVSLSLSLSTITITTTAPFAGDAFDTDAREAVAFAVLANECLHARAQAALPAVTGAARASVLGGVYPGWRQPWTAVVDAINQESGE